jgi:nidogen (entactin)
VNKEGVQGQALKLAPGGNGRVYGLTVIRTACPGGSNACERSNGGCSQLCLPRPDYSRVCACSDNAADECFKSV